MIPHSRPSLSQDDIQAVTEALRSGQVGQGPNVERFERGIAALIGIRGGVAVSSGTAALELALRSMGIGAGDEVVLPSYVCAAPWLAITRVGAEPRLADIELESFAIDPGQVEEAAGTKTQAVIVPHMFGLAADMGRLGALGIPLIEDCAQALGASAIGRPVGATGSVAICSFYATKLLCTGEGGMVLSNEEPILKRARALREYDEEPSLETLSFNFKMTDMQAALGLAQLERFGMFLARRSAIAAQYQKAFRDLDAILPGASEDRSHIFFRYVIRVPRLLDDANALIDVLTRLEQRGVRCRRPVFRPIHHYLGMTGFPKTDEAYRTAISIPIYPSMTDEEVAQTARIVLEELA